MFWQCRCLPEEKRKDHWMKCWEGHNSQCCSLGLCCFSFICFSKHVALDFLFALGKNASKYFQKIFQILEFHIYFRNHNTAIYSLQLVATGKDFWRGIKTFIPLMHLLNSGHKDGVKWGLVLHVLHLCLHLFVIAGQCLYVCTNSVAWTWMWPTEVCTCLPYVLSVCYLLHVCILCGTLYVQDKGRKKWILILIFW